jgi:hypothetical protein
VPDNDNGVTGACLKCSAGPEDMGPDHGVFACGYDMCTLGLDLPFRPSVAGLPPCMGFAVHRDSDRASISDVANPCSHRATATAHRMIEPQQRERGLVMRVAPPPSTCRLVVAAGGVLGSAAERVSMRAHRRGCASVCHARLRRAPLVSGRACNTPAAVRNWAQNQVGMAFAHRGSCVVGVGARALTSR